MHITHLMSYHIMALKGGEEKLGGGWRRSINHLQRKLSSYLLSLPLTAAAARRKSRRRKLAGHLGSSHARMPRSYIERKRRKYLCEEGGERRRSYLSKRKSGKYLEEKKKKKSEKRRRTYPLCLGEGGNLCLPLSNSYAQSLCMEKCCLPHPFLFLWGKLM